MGRAQKQFVRSSKLSSPHQGAISAGGVVLHYMQPIVSIVKCEDYTQERVNEAVRQAIELAGLRPEFDSGKRVLLNPNLLSSRLPDEAVTTHPSVVEALGRLALDSGCEVTLGDSPPFAGENPANYARLCERTGMTSVARDLGVPIVRFEDEVMKVDNPEGRFYHSFELAGAVVNSDLIVNIPKLKTHGLTAFSGAVKNVFGCVPGIRKGLFHVQAAEDRKVFAQMLVDLVRAVKPVVNVIDAVIGMEGEGPNAGRPRQIGLILASSDPVALDAVACRIVGIEPMSVHTTRLADEQELGVGRLDAIEIRGEPIESVSVSGFKESSGANDWARIPAPIQENAPRAACGVACDRHRPMQRLRRLRACLPCPRNHPRPASGNRPDSLHPMLLLPGSLQCKSDRSPPGLAGQSGDEVDGKKVTWLVRLPSHSYQHEAV